MPIDSETMMSAVAICKSIPGTAVARAEEALSDAQEALEQAGTVLESIPEDYSELSADVVKLKEQVGDITDSVASKNLYDKNSCNPQNSKFYSSSGGTLSDSASYATTGKIPVQAETQYTFSGTEFSTTYSKVNFFSGTNGETFISQQSSFNDLTFTTPANCTYIAVNLFARSHTTEEYNAAINAAQLETGDHATAYVPYGDTTYVPLDSVGENGELGDIFTEVHGKNMYDKSTCEHEDSKAYNNSTGAVQSSSYFAVTGIIPCGGGCVYTFSAGGTDIKSAVFFADGIYISSTVLYYTEKSLTITTPVNCNGVGFNLFADEHTTEQYNAAINAAQLEAGDRATEYEAYSSQTTPGYTFIEQGIGVNVGKTISQKAMTDLLAYPKRTTWWYGRKGDSLGDSITYKFDNFQKFVKAYLGLAEFYNNGMTGTKMAGPTDPTWGDSMWMDSRINALHDDAEFVTVLGGANDSSLEAIGDLTLDNCDTDTYAGAFNVVLSKIYYRYNALDSGRYNDIDYTGVTKLTTPHNILIIPCTQFYFPGGLANGKQKADAIRTLSELWGLKVCDFWSWAQANPGVAGVYWTQSDQVHPTALFYKERLAPLLISSLCWLQPIDFSGVE